MAKGTLSAVTEILNRFPALEEIEPNGVARRYRLPGAMGAVGLITPMSHEFCGACRRIRVTADGKLKGCLHSREEISLRDFTAGNWRTPSYGASCISPRGTTSRNMPAIRPGP